MLRVVSVSTTTTVIGCLVVALVFHARTAGADSVLRDPAWNIVWSDEFEGTNINLNNWTFETGNNGGWGNSELEYYTARSQNAYASNGLLHIAARKEAYNGFNYTSARMKTQGLFAKKYGRIEFRAKLPAGLGYWPALWLLGSNIGSVGWPACGEIDVMENKGSSTGQVQGSIHFSNAGNSHLSATALYALPGGGTVTDFHIYVLEWTTNQITWSVDGQIYESQSAWSSSTGPYPAPFNQPFFMVMNLAIGGNYLGNPNTNTLNANTVFPAELQVDYVRVWDFTPPLQLAITNINGSAYLTWPTNIVCHLLAQTNIAGLETNWVSLPVKTSPFLVPAVPVNGCVFYRLQSP